MRHHLFTPTLPQTTALCAEPICEADVVTTGFEILCPCQVGEMRSIGMTPAEILEAFPVAKLSAIDLEILVESAMAH